MIRTTHWQKLGVPTFYVNQRTGPWTEKQIVFERRVLIFIRLIIFSTWEWEREKFYWCYGMFGCLQDQVMVTLLCNTLEPHIVISIVSSVASMIVQNIHHQSCNLRTVIQSEGNTPWYPAWLDPRRDQRFGPLPPRCDSLLNPELLPPGVWGPCSMTCCSSPDGVDQSGLG